MKTKKILGLFIICGFMLFGAQAYGADDISQLKEQIKALQSTIDNLKQKVEALENKQKTQSENVEKIPVLEKRVENIESSPDEFTENLSVGGHFKFYLFDQTHGSRNDASQHTNVSAGIHNLYLYFRKGLSDVLDLDLQTNTEITAAATPSLGSNITRSTSATTETYIHQAFMTWLIGENTELKAGVFNPMFSEEYAKELWWHEQYNMNKGMDTLQGWHDTGIELYKNFDFAKWSLPVNASLLNGNTSYYGSSNYSQFVDNNEGKTVLLHIAPEMLDTRLRLLGSFAYGKWDADNNNVSRRHAAGLEYTFKDLNVKSEYIRSEFDNITLTGGNRADAEREGYYIKTLYRFTPKWRGLVNFSHADLYKATNAMLTDTYDVITFGANYFITEGSTIIGELSLVDADRSDGSEELKYRRFTLGWRTTF